MRKEIVFVCQQQNKERKFSNITVEVYFEGAL